MVVAVVEAEEEIVLVLIVTIVRNLIVLIISIANLAASKSFWRWFQCLDIDAAAGGDLFELPMS